MIISTTNQLEGHSIESYEGLVSGDAIVGAHVFKDLFAGFRDFFGGRSRGYEKTLSEARNAALDDMITAAEEIGDIDAIIGLTFDAQTMGPKNSMLAVTVTGTAVKLK